MKKTGYPIGAARLTRRLTQRSLEHVHSRVVVTRAVVRETAELLVDATPGPSLEVEDVLDHLNNDFALVARERDPHQHDELVQGRPGVSFEESPDHTEEGIDVPARGTWHMRGGGGGLSKQRNNEANLQVHGKPWTCLVCVADWVSRHLK